MSDNNPLHLHYWTLDKPHNEYNLENIGFGNPQPAQFSLVKGNQWQEGNITAKNYKDDHIRTIVLQFFPLCDVMGILKRVKSKGLKISVEADKIDIFDNGCNNATQLDVKELVSCDYIVFSEHNNSVHVVFCGRIFVAEARGWLKEAFVDFVKHTTRKDGPLEIESDKIYKIPIQENVFKPDQITDIPDCLNMGLMGTKGLPDDLNGLAAYLINMENRLDKPIEVIQVLEAIVCTIDESISNNSNISRIDFDFTQLKLCFDNNELKPIILKHEQPNGVFKDNQVVCKAIKNSRNIKPFTNESYNSHQNKDASSPITPNPTLFSNNEGTNDTPTETQEIPEKEIADLQIMMKEQKLTINFNNRSGKIQYSPDFQSLLNESCSLNKCLIGVSEYYQIELNTILEELFARVPLPQINLKVDKKGTSWQPSISCSNTKDESAKIKKLDQEVQEKRTMLATDLRKFQKEKRVLEQIIKLSEAKEVADLPSLYEEYKRQVNELSSKVSSLSMIVDFLDSTPEKAKEKAQYLSQALAPGSLLKDTPLEDLQKRIVEMAKTYQKTGQLLSEMDIFQSNAESLLLRTFTKIKEEVTSKYNYFTESYNKLNSKLIITEAIKSNLADPQLRTKLDLDINNLNSELMLYNLAIDLPQRGTQADPSKHKFVGYDSGGTRGHISSVAAWGLVELENETYKRTIYKSEVRIYQ